ncbi:MAG: hypothetical protein ACI85G_000447, partial [Psychroserpens sp.]
SFSMGVKFETNITKLPHYRKLSTKYCKAVLKTNRKSI